MSKARVTHTHRLLEQTLVYKDRVLGWLPGIRHLAFAANLEGLLQRCFYASLGIYSLKGCINLAGDKTTIELTVKDALPGTQVKSYNASFDR